MDEMIENWKPAEPLSDAQLAGKWAGQAFAEARYELGAAIGRIAVQAHRLELADEIARNAQMHTQTPAPPTRIYDEVSAATDDACIDEWQPAHQAGSHPEACATCSTHGPTGNGDADLHAVAQLAKTEVFGAAVTPQLATPEASRCMAEITRGDMIEICHAVIYWQHGTIGDGNVTLSHAGWLHVHPELDQDHVATAG